MVLIRFREFAKAFLKARASFGIECGEAVAVIVKHRTQVALKLARQIIAYAGLPRARIIIRRDNAVDGGAQSLLLLFGQFHHLRVILVSAVAPVTTSVVRRV